MTDDAISKDSVVIERTFEAPVDLIWQMWTDPEHFKKWYGPQGFTVPVAEMDVRVGGRRLVCMEMKTPDRTMKMCTTGEHTAVDPHRRLSYTESMADELGNVVPMGDSPHPMTTEVTVILAGQDGGTRLTLTHAGVPAGSPGASGWEQALGKLADHLEAVTRG